MEKYRNPMKGITLHVSGCHDSYGSANPETSAHTTTDIASLFDFANAQSIFFEWAPDLDSLPRASGFHPKDFQPNRVRVPAARNRSARQTPSLDVRPSSEGHIDIPPAVRSICLSLSESSCEAEVSRQIQPRDGRPKMEPSLPDWSPCWLDPV